MAFYKNFYIDTTRTIDLLIISHEVRRVIKEAQIDSGFVLITLPQPGAGLTILENENLEGLKKSLDGFLGNGLLRCLLPKSLAVSVEKGEMACRPRQEIFVIDYDTSGRRREFCVQAHTEAKAGAEGGQPQGMPGGL